MHGIVAPPCATAIEQPQAPVGIAFAMAKPPAQEAVATGHPIYGRNRIGERFSDAGRQLRRNEFVRVDAKHPVIARLVDRELLLAPEPEPLLFEHAYIEAACNLQRAIGAAGIDDHDLVAKSE